MDSANQRFPEDVADVLRKAGWFEGRRVEQAAECWTAALDELDAFEIFPAARDVLAEFGGIQVDQEGQGVDCAREPFRIIPLAALDHGDGFAEWATVLGTQLYPLGEAAAGQYLLTIDDEGRVCLLMADAQLLGDSFDEALVHLIRGIPGRQVDVMAPVGAGTPRL